jgi:rhamnosyltransferase
VTSASRSRTLTGAPPRISVVIPVKNESAGLAACLEGVLGQTVPVEEILVIDSGSTDGTQAIARGFDKVRLIEIPPSEFNHGDTRNLGVREAVGEFVLFTVGDARPVSDDWIAQLLAGFVADDVVAVSGAQVVPKSAHTNPVEWFRPVSQPSLSVFRFGDRAAFEAADPIRRWQATSIDDVTTIYRRAALLETPFRRLVYGEDVFFGLDALTGGKAVAFNPAARVYHYHLENYATVLKRTIAVASLRYRMTGYLTPPHRFAPSFLRAVARLMRTPGLSWPERLRWARYNLALGRALRDGLRMVHAAEREGGDAMDRLHEAYCGTPPAPLKPAPPTSFGRLAAAE